MFTMRFFEPSDFRADSPSPMPRGDAGRTAGDLRLLDDAVDYAARIAKATVGEFLAAPVDGDSDVRDNNDGTSHSLEIGVEFLVPPCSLDDFARELDRALIRRSPQYAAARRGGQAGAIRVIALPPSAFHQWRSAWRIDPSAQHARRWSDDRELLDGILRQASTGWREIFPVG
jgi:hypothetical protein